MGLLDRIAKVADRSADKLASAVEFMTGLPVDPPAPSHSAAPSALLEPKADPSREKRSIPREAVKLSGTVAVGFVGIPEPIELRDLTTKGMRLIAPFRLGVGEVAEVVVTLPPTPRETHPQKLHYQVRVAHAQQVGESYVIGASIRRCLTEAA
jgi:hypothetical protein